MSEPPDDPPDDDDAPLGEGSEPSLLDGVFLEAGTDADDSGEGGLDLDSSQADEIRDIFLTTLPQYIEPIEQMMEQAFGGETPDDETCKALGAAITSISTAASRIGIDDVWRELERMVHQVEELSEGAEPAEVKEQLEQCLAKIREIASIGDGPTASQGPPVRTLFDALRGSPHVDASVLEKFTAAGLVNVDQLTMARSDEIIAVTGLPDRVVQTVLAAITAAEPPATDDETPQSELVTQFTQQVNAEAALEDVRARNTRMQAEVDSVHVELDAMTASRDSLRRDLADARNELAARQPVLSQVRQHRHLIDSKRSARLAELERTSERLDTQRRNERTAESLEQEQAASVSELVQRVKRLLDRGA